MRARTLRRLREHNCRHCGISQREISATSAARRPLAPVGDCIPDRNVPPPPNKWTEDSGQETNNPRAGAPEKTHRHCGISQREISATSADRRSESGLAVALGNSATRRSEIESPTGTIHPRPTFAEGLSPRRRGTPLGPMRPDRLSAEIADIPVGNSAMTVGFCRWGIFIPPPRPPPHPPGIQTRPAAPLSHRRRFRGASRGIG